MGYLIFILISVSTLMIHSQSEAIGFLKPFLCYESPDIVDQTLIFDFSSVGGTFGRSILRYDDLLYYGPMDFSSSKAELVICCSLGTDNIGNQWKTVNMVDIDLIASYTGVLSIGVFDNYLYLGMNSLNGSGDILICNNKSAGGDSRYCDNVNDFIKANNPNTGYRAVWSMVNYLDHVYAGMGWADTKGDIYICTKTNGGDINICDVPNDWSLSYNGDGNIVMNLVNHRGYLYASLFYSPTNIMLIYCDPSLTLDSSKCESGDWVTSALRTLPGFPLADGPTSMTSLDNCLYIGLSVSINPYADIYRCCKNKCSPSDWKQVYDGVEDEVTTMSVWHSELVFSTGTGGQPGHFGNLYRMSADLYTTQLVDTWSGQQTQRVIGLYPDNDDLYLSLTGGPGESHAGDLYKVNRRYKCKS